MAAVVSSLYDFLQKNPNAQLTFGQVDHELQHIKIRERISSFATLASTVLLVLSVAGIVGGGMFSVGALAAIAAVAALYNWATREAESALRSRQVQWMNSGKEVETGAANPKAIEKESAPAESYFGKEGFLGFNWFSSSSTPED